LKKFLKFIGIFILFVFVLLIGVYFAVKQENVQNWLAKKVTIKLSEKLGTTVTVDHIKIEFLNHLNLEGVYIQDLKKDTLLYAGEVQFKITDWFFLKKTKPVISYIGLSDAIVNINRPKKDSIWNYAFIARAFAPSSKIDNHKPPTIADQKVADTTIAFDLQSIDLKNIRYNSIDPWVGENLKADIGSLELDARKIDWKKKWIDVANITIDKTKITYEDYVAGRPKRIKKDTIDTTPFNPFHWRITLDDLKMNESAFVYNKDNEKPTPNVFDEEHIDLKNIELHFKKVVINDDTATCKIVQLKALDRCGFELKNLQANAIISPIYTKLNQLLITTNRSTIQDTYEMSYSRFPDFYDYINKVVMKCNFKKSNISFQDIAYFAPQINALTVKNVTIENGTALGTVANLVAKDVNITVNNSRLIGNLSMRGLPDINTTFIELESKNLQTSGPELIKFVPSANTPNVAWKDLSSINFKGKYKGYIQDFITDGTLTTNLGAVQTNIHFTFLKDKQPTYNGFFSTTNLQLGKIIKQTIIGNISASGNIDGSGFDLDNLHTTFNGDINSIETNTYTYQNIRIDGKMNQRKFEGKINANDPNLAMNFEGKFDFSTANPDFNLKTKLTAFNLKSLGITTQDIKGSAYMDLNFKGNSLDNFTGKAKLYNVNISNASKSIYLDSAILTSTPSGKNKYITLRSSAVDADLNGQFAIAHISDAVQYYLSSYLPNYISAPLHKTVQNFSFKVHTKEIDTLLKTFVNDISGLNNANIVGNIDMNNRNLSLDVNTPNFIYDKYKFEAISINAKGNFDSLQLNGSTSKILISNQEIIPSSSFSTILSKDTAVVNITTAGGAYNVKNANLQAKGFAENKKLYLHILPSSFYFNQSKWDLFTDDYVVFEKIKISTDGKTASTTKITLGKLNLTSGLQKIALQTQGENQENIIAHVENIDIEELSKFSNDPVLLQGRINGDVTINNYISKPAYSGDISTTEIKYKGDTLGQLFLNASYDDDKKIVAINNTSGLLFKNDKTIFYGTIDVKEKEPNLDLHTTLNNIKISTFEKFFEGFITNTKGTANGNIDIVGSLKNYKLNGKININDLYTKVIYLGTTYHIKNGTIQLNEKDINLGKIKMYDELGNDADLSGHIYHDHFNNLRFGQEFGEQTPITVVSKKFLFLKTAETDNDLYYGNVIANGAMFLSGPLENLYMDITATTLSGSHFTLPIRGSFDASEYDFIKYKSYGQAEVTEKKVVEKNRLLINLLIEATPDAEMKILMDPATGEEIVGRGEGRINMIIDLNNEIKMTGDYTIDKGTYGYTFRNIIKKDLVITPGGNIKWDGKPLEAKLNLEASYATKANLVPLLASELDNLSATDKDLVRISYPTNVIIQLTGPMLAPIIKFDITQPNNTDLSSRAYNKLKELKSDDQKLLVQAGSLIIQNQFLNTESGLGGGINTNATVLNTINGVVSSTLSNILTQNISKWIGAKNLDFAVDYKNGRSDTGSTHQLNYVLKKTYFNDRVSFEIGDNISYLTTTGTTNFSVLPNDFKFKYFINPEGKVSVSVFRTTFTDIINNGTQDQKIGIGLNYRKSFNRFSELWKKNIASPVFIPIDDTIRGGTK
jgi:TamB, inner membrane protein subunit of TAM complex